MNSEVDTVGTIMYGYAEFYVRVAEFEDRKTNPKFLWRNLAFWTRDDSILGIEPENHILTLKLVSMSRLSGCETPCRRF